MLPNLQVGSALIFPSARRTPASNDAVNYIKYEIKQNQNNAIAVAAARLAQVIPGTVLESLFNGPAVLVPVPGHARRVDDGLWVAEKLCEELVKRGLGQQMLPLITRVKVVRRSSGASSGSQRPDPRTHYESLTVNSGIGYPSKLVLVDDVVTRGATLIACATHLNEHFPEAEVTAFALARVESDIDLHSKADRLSPAIQWIFYDEDRGSIKRRHAPSTA